MTQHHDQRTISRFADLKTLYAEATATPEFQAAFGDPMPLSIVDIGEAPGEHDMPDPLAAQSECGGVIAAIFDLFGDTRLEPLAAEIAWGFVNSFHSSQARSNAGRMRWPRRSATWFVGPIPARCSIPSPRCCLHLGDSI